MNNTHVVILRQHVLSRKLKAARSLRLEHELITSLMTFFLIKIGSTLFKLLKDALKLFKSGQNRPKLFPGFIGGHCVIPNLDLASNPRLDIIKELNNNYKKILKL